MNKRVYDMSKSGNIMSQRLLYEYKRANIRNRENNDLYTRCKSVSKSVNNNVTLTTDSLQLRPGAASRWRWW